MPAVVVRDDQVERIGVVELVDFVLIIHHRHVPAEKIDEETLAVGEHGSKQALPLRGLRMVDDVDHGLLPSAWPEQKKQR